MALRDKTNGEVFQLYDSDLVLRLRNVKNLTDTRKMLSDFREYLGEYPPSRELAKGFLARYAGKKPRTLYRYSQMIKLFMAWYGEPLDDLRVKIPKTLPAYTEDSDVEKLLQAVGNKRSHKGCIERDLLLVEVAWRSGLRRSELAALAVKDVHADAIMVRGGKGGKDRVVPLPHSAAAKLNSFIKDKMPDEKVFGLGGPSIGMKIKQWAKRAGLTDFHTHTLRHKYATDLLESGANVREVQALLGHENLNTTQVYLSITEQGLRDAVRRLDQPKDQRTGQGIKAAESCESSIEVTLPPVPSGPGGEPPKTVAYVPFVLPVSGDRVLLESVQVRTSDPRVPYELMVFEDEPPDEEMNWANEDVVQSGEIRQRVFTYCAAVPVACSDREKKGRLYGGICIGQRPIDFSLRFETESDEAAHYRAPVTYRITVRYRPGE